MTGKHVTKRCNRKGLGVVGVVSFVPTPDNPRTNDDRDHAVGLLVLLRLTSNQLHCGILLSTAGGQNDNNNNNNNKPSRSPRIPHRLSFNYKTNVLESKEPAVVYKNIENTIRIYQQAWNSTDSTVSFLTDNDCRVVLETAEPRLVPFFNNETEGQYKSDICRVADLYLHGGYYFDNDMRAIEAVVFPDWVSFSSVLEENSMNFFQSFLACSPKHPVLRKSMDIMLDYYEGKYHVAEGRLFSGMGTATLKDGFDAAVKEDPRVGEEALFLHEISLHTNPSLYKDLPRQGVRPMCDIIVHRPEQNKVFFFSRAVGTEKC
jgi:Glycosyltransferase sugar-binding region containing DXD motif